ncbi:MAG: O-antigen ligase family protein [Candidatus Omnitrophica bacterium]|nr:O-antigen ligase family protein [Candidatus Omnitrophota bacterium]
MTLRRALIEDILTVSVLIVSPMLFGSVYIWAFSLVFFVTAILFFSSSVFNVDDFKKVIKEPVTLLFLAFLAVNILYVIPFPSDVIRAVSPETVLLRERYAIDQEARQCLSVYPHATALFLLKVTGCLLFYLYASGKLIAPEADPGRKKDHPDKRLISLAALAGVLSLSVHAFADFSLRVPSNGLYFAALVSVILALGMPGDKAKVNVRFLMTLVNGVILAGFFTALFGMVQALSWNGKIYWLLEKQGGVFGPFINNNNYAGFIEMCIPFPLVLFVDAVVRSSLQYKHRAWDKFLWFFSDEASGVYLYLTAAVVMIVSLFMTPSSGGMISFTVSFFMIFITLTAFLTSGRKRNIFLSALVISALFWAMLAWVGPDVFKGEVDKMRGLLNGDARTQERIVIWKDSIGIMKDYPILGTGLGTFPYIYSKYRTLTDTLGARVEYAENEYVQLAVETGAAGTAFALFFLVFYFKRFGTCVMSLKKWRTQRHGDE